jgi:hypothetical protein
MLPHGVLVLEKIQRDTVNVVEVDWWDFTHQHKDTTTDIFRLLHNAFAPQPFGLAVSDLQWIGR